MDWNSDLRKLVELIFIKSEIALKDSAIPTHFQGYDFYTKMRYVMFIRKFVITYRWGTILEDQCCRMLSSHEMYLAFVMQACLTEIAFNSNDFDCFISVCCLVEYFNSVTFQISGVNYSDLNSDIVMVFYGNFLHLSFITHGNLKEFVPHIIGHKYLEWKWDKESIISRYGSNVDYTDKLDKEVIREILHQCRFRPDFALNNITHENCITMSLEVLSTTSLPLPHLPEERYLFEIDALRQNRSHEEKQLNTINEIISELNNLEKLWPGCSISNSDCTKTDSANLQSTKAHSVKLHSSVSKGFEDFEKYAEVIEIVTKIGSTNMQSTKGDSISLHSSVSKGFDDFEKREEVIEAVTQIDSTNMQSTKTDSISSHSSISKGFGDFEKHEKVLEAVIHHNRSRRPGLVDSDSQFHKKAEELLENMKTKVNSLIVLLSDSVEE